MIPDDLITLREAEANLGVSVDTIRRWISIGKNGKILQTYRRPGHGELTLVSKSTVIFFRDLKFKASRRLATGGLTLRLSETDAAELRKLALLMSNRIGIPISYAEAMREAVRRQTKMEESRY